MATQSLEFGYTTGQTLTAKLFAIGSDTLVATANTVTEATNRKGRYVAAYTDVAAGDYLQVVYIGSDGVSSECYTLTFTTATFTPWSERKAALVSDVPTPPAAAAIADAVWDEPQAGHTTAGTFGKYLDAQLSLVDGGTTGAQIVVPLATAQSLGQSELTLHRGSTWTPSTTVLSLTAGDKCYFTMKVSGEDDTDAEAVLQAHSEGGLLVLNGEEARDSTLATIEHDGTRWNVTIDADATAEIDPGQYDFDIKRIASNGTIAVLAAGTIEVVPDVTRAVANP